MAVFGAFDSGAVSPVTGAVVSEGGGTAVIPGGTDDFTVVVGSGTGANGDVRLFDPTTGTLRIGIVPFVLWAGAVAIVTSYLITLYLSFVAETLFKR